MTRRDVLTLAAAPLAFAKVKARPGSSTSTWQIHESDFAGILATVTKIKNLKYQAFDTSFRNLHFGPTAEDHARQLSGIGLKLVGVWMAQYTPDGVGIPDDDLVDHVAKGCIPYRADRLIVHSDERESPRQIVQALTAASRMSRRNSMDLAYSPAAREFANSGAAIDSLLEQIDAKQVRLVVDTAEVLKASADPVIFFSKNHKRIDELHLRDARDAAHVPLGAGTLDLKDLAHVIESTGWKGWLMNGEESTENLNFDAAASAAREQVQRVFGL